MERTAWIAAQARRFRLLADRPDLLYPEPAQRAERALGEARPALDASLIAGADEADRICAAAVAMLREPGATVAPILELIAALPRDYLFAIYHALPEDRRAVCERDGVWAYHLRREPDGIDGAIADLEYLATLRLDLDGLTVEEQAAFERFSAETVRRRLGLEHDLSLDEETLAVAAEDALDEAWASAALCLRTRGGRKSDRRVV